MNTQLSDLMQRATENLEPVTPDLLERSVQQGLRLRRRRTTVLSLTGAGAVLATVGVIAGGVQLLSTPADSAAAATPIPLAKPTPVAKPTQVTSKQTLATLRALVEQHGKLSKPETWGTLPTLFSGSVFALGLVLVVLAGSELLTGNMALVPIAMMKRRVGLRALGQNFTIVLIGNLIGSLFVAYFLAGAGLAPMRPAVADALARPAPGGLAVNLGGRRPGQENGAL